MTKNLLVPGRRDVFQISIEVVYRGRRYTAVYFDSVTKRYQLRGNDGSLTFAPESALKVAV